MQLPPEIRGQIETALTGAVASFDKAFLGIGDFIQTVVTAFYQVGFDLRQFEKFDFNPKFKTRVISIPRAIEGGNDLYHTVKDDLLQKLNEVVETIKAIKANLEDLRTFRDPGMRGLVRIEETMAAVHQFLINLGKEITKIVEVASILTDIKQRIETLDDLFLPNGSTKKTVDITYRKRNAS